MLSGDRKRNGAAPYSEQPQIYVAVIISVLQDHDLVSFNSRYPFDLEFMMVLAN